MTEFLSVVAGVLSVLSSALSLTAQARRFRHRDDGQGLREVRAGIDADGQGHEDLPPAGRERARGASVRGRGSVRIQALSSVTKPWRV
ncbi:hypothetical protein [Streptomyces sp. NPDC001404]|uniref:hypothetical protein n=1 Tax=Streptomyces sp. NPDC001404 TaxID=3364571 RepID=UPI00369DA890